MRGAGFLLTPQPCLGHQEPPAARRALGTLLPSHRDPRLAWKPNLSCSIPPPSHLDTSRALTKPQPSSSQHLLQLLIWVLETSQFPKGRESFTPEPHLGSAGRSGRRGWHGGAAVVALAGAGAGSCRGGRPGGGFGSPAPRPERGHSLRGSFRQDELLPQLQVGPSSCWKGRKGRRTKVRRDPTSSPGIRRLQGWEQLPWASPHAHLRGQPWFSCSALKPPPATDQLFEKPADEKLPQGQNSQWMLSSSLVQKHPDGF